MTSPLLLFVHIPKTAGTTTWYVLRRQYPRDSVLRFKTPNYAQNELDLQAKLEADTGELNVVGGHVPFGFHRFTQRPYAYFTLLREPTERVISDYYRIIRQPADPQHIEFTQGKVSLKEGLMQMGCNISVLFLAGENPWETQATAEHLKKAKQVLHDEMRVVGLTEHFDQSLMLMQQAFGWKTPFYQMKNVARNRPSEIAPEAYRLAAKLNALDVELYEYAGTLFNAQWSENRQLLEPRLRRFQWLLPWYQRWQSLRNKPTGKD